MLLHRFRRPKRYLPRGHPTPPTVGIGAQSMTDLIHPTRITGIGLAVMDGDPSMRISTDTGDDMFRRTTRPAPHPDVRTVSFDPDASDDKTLTWIGNPDLLSPIAHSLPRMDPHDTDLRAVVTQVVEALAARGALDEFTVNVLDGWIDRERSTWDAQVREAAQQRRRTAATVLGQHRQNATVARDNLVVLRDRRDRFAAEYDAACREADLPSAAKLQTSPDAPAPVAEPFAFHDTLLARELLETPHSRPTRLPTPAAQPLHPAIHPSTAIQNGDLR